MDRHLLEVYLVNEGVYGQVVGPVGAYFSLVQYTFKGIDYEVLVENEDFVIVDDIINEDAWDL